MMETFQPLGVGLVQSSSTVIPYGMGGIAAVRHKSVRWSTLEKYIVLPPLVVRSYVEDIWATNSWCPNGYQHGNFAVSTG